MFARWKLCLAVSNRNSRSRQAVALLQETSNRKLKQFNAADSYLEIIH